MLPVCLRNAVKAGAAGVLLAFPSAFAETVLWSQDFADNAEGLAPVPASVQVDNGELALSTAQSATLYFQRTYPFGTGLRIEAGLRILNESDAGSDEVQLGLRNVPGDRRHTLTFHSGHIHVKRRGAVGEQSLTLGPYQLDTLYRVELEADPAQGTAVRVYPAAGVPADGVSDAMPDTDWQTLNGLIRLERNDSGAPVQARLDNLVEVLPGPQGSGTVLWDQDFSTDADGLTWLGSYFNVSGGRLQFTGPTGPASYNLYGEHRYAPQAGVRFSATLTPQAWGNPTYLGFGVYDQDLDHGHLASVIDGQWRALAVENNNYTETPLGPAQLGTDYRVAVRTAPGQTVLRVHPAGQPQQGWEHSLNQSGWVTMQTLLRVYTDTAGNAAQASVDDLREVLGTPPPTVTVTAPADGELVNTGTPVIALAYDSAAGIDTDTVELSENGAALDADCTTDAQSAQCTPVSPLADGEHTVSATVADIDGTPAEPADVTFIVDTVAPVVTLSEPADGLITNNPELTIAGEVSETGTVTATLNGATASLALTDLVFGDTATLAEGANMLTLTAVDPAGNQSTLTRTVTLDTQAPAVPDVSLISVTGPDDDGQFTVTGGDGSVEAGSTVTVINTRTGESVTVTANENGAFTAAIAAGAGDVIEIRATDAAGNTGEAGQTVINDLPPDPGIVAPPLDPTGITPFADATAFLYSGANPIQTGVEPGTIEARRAAVIRGRVLDRDNNPLPGVSVTVKDHPEFGQTRSRADGAFDLAVNGGGALTLNYYKDDYLPVQRKIQTPWRDYAFAEDVVLIQLDPQVTTIEAGSPNMQVAQGTPQADTDGPRQATVLFPAGTTATMTLPDGSTQSLTTLNVRATEYTVGDNGPEAMPGELPPASGYTYAVELSVDEAVAADATRVEFNQPIPLYVDNFLDFPTGEPVPLGWYDSERARWVAADDGRIVEILAVENNRAVLDVAGDGEPATQAELDQLGITADELIRLVGLYAPGDSLWRSPIPHFTPWDCNWPGRPPEDAEPPPQKPPETPHADEPDDSDDEDDCPGCVINPQSQSVGEQIPVTGTPFSLHYRSDRASGRKNNTVTVPLTGETIPGSLRGVDLIVEVAGQRTGRSFEPEPNLSYTYEWNGQDGFGRDVYGSATAEIEIRYRYPCIRTSSAGGGGGGGGGGSGNSSRSFAEVSTTYEPIGTRNNCQGFGSSQFWQVALDSPQRSPVNVIGNWSLNIQHAWESARASLRRGNGGHRVIPSGTIETVAGNGHSRSAAWPLLDGVPATESAMTLPYDVAVDANGSLYIATNANRIRKVDPDGIITTVAGNGNGGYAGDGGLATQAELNIPQAVAVDAAGNLYIADSRNHRIRRVDVNGIITTIAGTGEAGFSGDGGPATQARLNAPRSIALHESTDTLYIADTDNDRVRRIDPDGTISTVAGTGEDDYNGDGGPAAQTNIQPSGVAVDRDGNLYIAGGHRVRRVNTEGIITTIVGTGSRRSDGDGGPAGEAHVALPWGLAVDPGGSLYIAGGSHRIRRIGPDGIITTIAGSILGASGDGGPAADARLHSPTGMQLDAAGNLYVADRENHRVRKIANIGFVGTRIADQSGTQQYIFDESGRHRRTVDTRTGEILFEFGRNADGRLISVTDADGDVTVIERNAGGTATAIVSPDGQRTELSVDADGHLTSVINPATESWDMQYTADGLLTEFRDRKNQPTEFEYDEFGRLVRDTNAGGGGWLLERTDLENGYRTGMTTAEGRELTFTVEPQPDGTRIQRNTRADGSVQEKRFSPGGEEVTVHPDGTTITVQEGPDPRFGMQSPVPEQTTIATPSGLTSTTTVNRTAALSDAGDPFSHIALGETVTVNDRPFQSDYDAATRTFTDTTPEGRTATRTLNAQGRVARTQITDLSPVDFDYNAQGRLTQISEGAGAERQTAFSYYTSGTQAGYLESITDAENRTVTFEYDAAGRVTAQTLPDDRRIEYGYDANGNLTRIQPPGRPAHIFNYNAFDLEGQYIPPDIDGVSAPQTTYSYDLDKNLELITRPDGQTVDFQYNAATGQLEGVTTGGTGSTGQRAYSYTYITDTGQLDTITSPDNIVLDYGYDGFLLTDVDWSGGVGGSLDITYDNNFRVTQRCVNTTSCISLSYDDDSLLTGAGALSINRAPQRGGLVTGTTLGNTATARTYNDFGELQSVSADVDAGGVYDVSYTRDDLGRITDKTETVDGVTTTESYTYDQAGRMETVTRDGVVTTYSYDSNGNRLSKVVTGGDTEPGTYDDQDRLLSYDGCDYSYTANGELESKTCGADTTTYNYDTLGNLLGVTLSDGTGIEYLIDGQNRRVGKRVDGQLVQGFLYQDQLNPVAELNPDGSIESRFVYGTKPNVPAYMIRGGVTYRIISDHLGSPRLIVDTATGDIVQRMDYDEFGRVIQDTNPEFQPFGFAGGIYDSDTGLTRFGARDYDAQTGRWTTKDPIFFNGLDSNLYAYTFSDPINFIDPTGNVYQLSTAEAIIGALAIASHEAAVAATAVGAAFAAGYGAGTLVNYACGNCFGDFGIWIYDKTHPDPPWDQEPDTGECQ